MKREARTANIIFGPQLISDWELSIILQIRQNKFEINKIALSSPANDGHWTFYESQSGHSVECSFTNNTRVRWTLVHIHASETREFSGHGHRTLRNLNSLTTVTIEHTTSLTCDQISLWSKFCQPSPRRLPVSARVCLLTGGVPCCQ